MTQRKSKRKGPNMLLVDTLREIRNTRSRFISLLVLSALAVCFLSGLRATAPDMKLGADRYFDQQRLMDLRVVSTLGLTEEDVSAVAGFAGVAAAEGAYTVDASLPGAHNDYIVKAISFTGAPGLNAPKLVEGRLPEGPDECAVEPRLLQEAGLAIGDEITLDTGTGDFEDALRGTRYTIVGTADSPLYVGVQRGSSTLGTGEVNAFVLLPQSAFALDYYTDLYLQAEGAAELSGYSEEYDGLVDDLAQRLEPLGEERADARRAEIVDEANEKIADAEQELADAQAEADEELSEAEGELADAAQKLSDGWADYYEGEETFRREIADAEAELQEGETELADALKKLQDGEAEYADGAAELSDGWADYYEGLDAFADGWREISEGEAQYEAGLQSYEEGLRELEQAEEDFQRGLDRLDDAYEELEAGEGALYSQMEQLGLPDVVNQVLAMQGLPGYESNEALLRALSEERGGEPEEQPATQALLVVLTGAAEQLRQGLEQAQAGLAQLEAGIAQLEGQLAQLPPEDPARPALEEQLAQMEEQRAALEEQIAGLEGQLAQLEDPQQVADGLVDGWQELQRGWGAYEAGVSQVAGGRRQLKEARAQLEEAAAELESARQELSDGKAELADGEQELVDAGRKLQEGAAELADARAELDEGWADYYDGFKEWEDGKTTLETERADGERELADALKELQEGEADYAEGYQEYLDGKAEAEEKLADARKELEQARRDVAEIGEAEWYILDRGTNLGYMSYEMDADRMGNLASVFPLIFFLVAALVCLTTMTRMVEEQRVTIGGYKALGYSRGAIAVKYVGYGVLASALGSLLGLAVGLTLLPFIICTAWGIIYDAGGLYLGFYPGTALWSCAAAVGTVTAAALGACLSTLRSVPAQLLRPKSPPAGKRILLERITPLWRRMSFSHKITLRNLLRYKKRFFMTVAGIGGCAALIVTAFGLRDSIFATMDLQFDEIYRYTAQAGLVKDITPQERREVEDLLAESMGESEWLFVRSEALTARTGDYTVDCTLLVAPSQGALEEMVNLRHRTDEEGVALPEDGVVLTEKLSKLLGAGPGDTIVLDGDTPMEVRVADVTEHYIQHTVYMTEAYYRQLTGSGPEDNALLLRCPLGTEEGEGLLQRLLALDGVTSLTRMEDTRRTFGSSMESVDYAVALIIVCAAALAFVVLYNLTNINITERMRELATLKVLGFYDGELSAYVYRENVLLTALGVGVGLVLGKLLHQWLILTVEIDLLMFGRTISLPSYSYAVALTVLFSLAVNLLAHHKLKGLDMVESLKTVE